MPKYEGWGGRCLGQCQPGLRALRDAVDDYFPDAYDLGCYNCRPPSLHGEGRAIDIGFAKPYPNPKGTVTADWLVKHSEHLGVQEVIWNRRRWTTAKGWVRYQGKSPHIDHIHVSLTWKMAKSLTRAHIDRVRPGASTPPPGDDRFRPWPGNPSAKYGGYQRTEFKGHKDGNVQWIQARLIGTGAQIQADGFFGDRTHDAVVGFQSLNGLKADGIVGERTWMKLQGR